MYKQQINNKIWNPARVQNVGDNAGNLEIFNWLPSRFLPTVWAIFNGWVNASIAAIKWVASEIFSVKFLLVIVLDLHIVCTIDWRVCSTQIQVKILLLAFSWIKFVVDWSMVWILQQQWPISQQKIIKRIIPHNYDVELKSWTSWFDPDRSWSIVY